jgi:hypothetical protein
LLLCARHAATTRFKHHSTIPKQNKTALSIATTNNMGSYEVFHDFFPAAARAFEVVAPGSLAAWLAPGGPSPTYALGGGRVLRTPALLPFAVAGIAIGVAGGAALLLRQKAAAPRNAAAAAAAAALPVWAAACFYFAAMNAAGIAAHCLAPLGASTPFALAAIALDVAFTGCSSLCLLAASVIERSSSGGSSARTSAKQRASAAAATMTPRFAAAWLWVPVVGAALAGNVLGSGSSGGSVARQAGLNEVLYIATTLAAAAALSANELLPAIKRGGAAAKPAKGDARWICAAAFAAGGLFCGAALDTPLRKATGGWLCATHVAFFGSDAAFAALVPYVLSKLAGSQKQQRRRQ